MLTAPAARPAGCSQAAREASNIAAAYRKETVGGTADWPHQLRDLIDHA
jgi:hypothetical protein